MFGVEFITEAVFEDAVCSGGERVTGDRFWFGCRDVRWSFLR